MASNPKITSFHQSQIICMISPVDSYHHLVTNWQTFALYPVSTNRVMAKVHSQSRLAEEYIEQ